MVNLEEQQQKRDLVATLKEFLDVGIDDLNTAIFLLEAAQLESAETAVLSICVAELCAALRIRFYITAVCKCFGTTRVARRHSLCAT